jgi:hypothetical protein
VRLALDWYQVWTELEFCLETIRKYNAVLNLSRTRRNFDGAQPETDTPSPRDALVRRERIHPLASVVAGRRKNFVSR